VSRGAAVWRFFGFLLIVALPLLVATYPWPLAGLERYLAVFALALTAAHVGLVVRAGFWDWVRWIQDLAVAVLMAAGAYLAVHAALRAGGGPVDPALLAVLGAYGLIAWPAARST
jgi:hypothetical protein